MARSIDTGVYQKENGTWEYRFTILVDGKKISHKKCTDQYGNKFKTKKQALKAREIAMETARHEREIQKRIQRRTMKEVFEEFCENGRNDRAYQTIRKQDSLWEIHLREKFGKRFCDDITSAEVMDYLSELYYIENYSYQYILIILYENDLSVVISVPIRNDS